MLTDINEIYEKKLLSDFTSYISPLKKVDRGSRSFKEISPTKKKLERSNVLASSFNMIELVETKESKETDPKDMKDEEETKAEIEVIQEPFNNNLECPDFSKQGSINYLSTMVYGMENYVIERFKEEYLFRFKGMVLSLDEEKTYDTSPIYIEKAFEKLPWKSKFYYEEATDFKEYNYKHCPCYKEENSESKLT